MKFKKLKLMQHRKNSMWKIYYFGKNKEGRVSYNYSEADCCRYYCCFGDFDLDLDARQSKEKISKDLKTFTQNLEKMP